MSQSRSSAASVLFDDQLFVLGGRTEFNTVALCEVFDLNTGKWRDIAPLPAKRESCVAGLFLCELQIVG